MAVEWWNTRPCPRFSDRARRELSQTRGNFASQTFSGLIAVVVQRFPSTNTISSRPQRINTALVSDSLQDAIAALV